MPDPSRGSRYRTRTNRILMGVLVTLACGYPGSAGAAPPAGQLPSGALDPGFASGGVLGTTPDEYGTDAAIQADGKIVVLTTATYADYLSRYLPDGILDPTFGTGGSVALPNDEGRSSYSAIAIDGEGRIVVVGSEADRSWHSPPGSPEGEFGLGRSDGVVYRYMPNGSLDTSFGTNGKAMLSVPEPEGLTPGSASTYPSAVLASSANSLTIGGEVSSICRWVVGGVDEAWFEYGTFVTRLSSSGTPDAEFSDSGIVSTHGQCLWQPGAVGEYFTALAQPSPGSVLALSDEDGTWRFRFYSPTGELSERAVVPPTVEGAAGQAPTQVAVLPDHDLLVGGRIGGLQTLQRFTPQAELDPSFGAGGVAVVPMECLLCNEGMFAVTGDERILVGGVMEGFEPAAVGVIRYLPDGAVDESFGLGSWFAGLAGQAWARLVPESEEAYVSKILVSNGQPLVVGTQAGTALQTTLALFEADGGYASNPPPPKPGEGPFMPIPEPPASEVSGSAGQVTATTPNAGTNDPPAGHATTSTHSGSKTTKPAKHTVKKHRRKKRHHKRRCHKRCAHRTVP